MNCEELKKSIYDYVEKKLPEAERADFEQHMADCGPCGDLMAEVTKLTCKQFVDFLNDYFEDELPNEQRATFDRHMELCPPCKDYLDSYETTVELGRIACSEGDGVPPDVPDTLVRAILKARGKSA
jgi:anti-sigma factor RsiW